MFYFESSVPDSGFRLITDILKKLRKGKCWGKMQEHSEWFTMHPTPQDGSRKQLLWKHSTNAVSASPGYKNHLPRDITPFLSSPSAT